MNSNRDYATENINLKKRLEVLEKLVYTNQLENTANISNEFGRAFTILQNHCVVMEDTLYASEVLIKLINRYEKFKKVIEILKSYILVASEVDFDTYVTSNYSDEEVTLVKEVLGNEIL